MSIDNTQRKEAVLHNEDDEQLPESRLIANKMLASFDPFGLPQDNKVRPYAVWDPASRRGPVAAPTKPKFVPVQATVEVVQSRPGDMFRVVTRKHPNF